MIGYGGEWDWVSVSVSETGVSESVRMTVSVDVKRAYKCWLARVSRHIILVV